jgi:hypothetical protein
MLKQIERKPWPEEHERKPLPPTIRPVGRPSLYLQEYCQEIVEFCSRGYSPGAWAGSKRIARSTLDSWAALHPEFMEALRVARTVRQLDWEDQLLRQRSDPKATGPQVNATLFALRNLHSPDFSEQPPPEPQAQEQHRHVHIHAGMDAVAASEAYQRLLKEL